MGRTEAKHETHLDTHFNREVSKNLTSPIDNLEFVPKPIQAEGLRISGNQLDVAKPTIQRIAALQAYSAFSSGRNWMEKLSHAYVVALATRSADTYLMNLIQCEIPLSPAFSCAKCREATIGTKVIRKTLFPILHSHREYANDLLHHLDRPENQGVATLNIEGVFTYCFHLFEEQAALLFGVFPDGAFEFKACKEHRQR